MHTELVNCDINSSHNGNLKLHGECVRNDLTLLDRGNCGGNEFIFEDTWLVKIDLSQYFLSGFLLECARIVYRLSMNIFKQNCNNGC